MTTAGEVAPAENASASTSCPCTASGFCRKRSFCDRPVCTKNSPLAITPSTMNPLVATMTGRRETAAAELAPQAARDRVG